MDNPPCRDDFYLHHILDETLFLLENTQRISFEDLMEDVVLKKAVLRSLEIIGEASKNISSEFKEQHGAVPWRKVAGLRDKIIHHYFSVDWELIWDLLQNHIPELDNTLRPLLEEKP